MLVKFTCNISSPHLKAATLPPSTKCLEKPKKPKGVTHSIRAIIGDTAPCRRGAHIPGVVVGQEGLYSHKLLKCRVNRRFSRKSGCFETGSEWCCTQACTLQRGKGMLEQKETRRSKSVMFYRRHVLANLLVSCAHSTGPSKRCANRPLQYFQKIYKIRHVLQQCR